MLNGIGTEYNDYVSQKSIPQTMSRDYFYN